MKRLPILFRQNFNVLVIISLMYLSMGLFLFFFHENKTLYYDDGLSRLDISRKLVDNLTPGLGQLGNVWLPLPFLLMLPFVANSYLWHSGLAGYFVSGPMFILGGYYIYKSVFLLTKSRLTSVLSTSIYALNINMLYFQSTAMSESLFLATLSATIYYFLMWLHTNARVRLIPIAISISAMTLVRYEGLAILLSVIPTIYVISYLKDRKHSKAEGNLVLFTTMACLGFGLWTLYLTVIFGDPLYWLNYYGVAATPTVSVNNEAVVRNIKPFFSTAWEYLQTTIWMNGLIPVIYSILGVIIMFILWLKNRNLRIIPLLIPLTIFLFMVMTLRKNTPIHQPALNLDTIMSVKTSLYPEFNIRYGLLILPWIAIMSSFLFNIKRFKIGLIVYSLFFIQIFSYFHPVYTIIYQVPMRIEGTQGHVPWVKWLKDNYSGGLILISAQQHDPQMFQLGFDYKKYIHEGTREYWKDSVNNPTKYASWVVLDYRDPQMELKYMKNIAQLEIDYEMKLDDGKVRIYKIKNQPHIIVNN